jgi:ubiquitin C-terminal hydrolase
MSCEMPYLLIDHIRSNPNMDLAEFKQQLARFNGFFDGSIQRDAYECFILILNIMNSATKVKLVVDISLDDDDYVSSLTKRLFMFTTKELRQCVTCRYLTTAYNHTHVLLIHPSIDIDIKNTLANGLMSKMPKQCFSCHSNTEHEETITIEYPPEVLVIVINRFDPTFKRSKNQHKVTLDREILVASNKYHLIGTIHHHGNTCTAGHYVSNIFHPESAYTCNDNHVTPLNTIGPSDTVYMMYYKRDNSSLLPQ